MTSQSHEDNPMLRTPSNPRPSRRPPPAAHLPAATAAPVDDVYAYQYHTIGQENQILEVSLLPGQTIQTEKGAMAYRHGNVSMNTTRGGRGAVRLVKRRFSGEDFLMNRFTNEDPTENAAIGIAPPIPAHIVPIYITPSGPSIVCRKDAYLAGHPSILLSITRTKLRAALLKQTSLTMQRLEGFGHAFILANGCCVTHDLAPGEQWSCQSETLLAFDETVTYDATLNPGIKNILFGGEGLFNMSLTGPGRIYLQSPTHFKLSASHIRYAVNKAQNE